MADLAWLRDRGLASAIVARASLDTPVLGICGGYQMLGVHVTDEDGVEGNGSAQGLGLLPVTTTFGNRKQTRRVVARLSGDSALWCVRDVTDAVDGYEIHMGRTTVIPQMTVGQVPFVVEHGVDRTPDGCCSADGLVVGTYVHGLLENASLRGALLARLATRKGVALPNWQPVATFDKAIDDLADAVRDNLDCAAISRLVGLSLGGGQNV
jgi:adenosylcobyric acid synthase